MDLGSVTIYALAKKLGIDHPYRVQYAIEQLIKNKHLIRNSNNGVIVRVRDQDNFKGLIHIPWYGEVSCGPASAYAHDSIQGFLPVSPSVIHSRDVSRLFALRAVGDSMTHARIGGHGVNQGDFVLVERLDGWDKASDGAYIISVIEDCANLKMIRVDNAHRRIFLLSESSNPKPPIVISRDDMDYYRLIGKAVEVIKIPAESSGVAYG